MKSIGTRFSLAVGGLALVFSGIILYRKWVTTKVHTDELTSRQAALALAFDLAIRQYAAEAIRPAMEKLVGKDEFVIEAMSCEQTTSTQARHELQAGQSAARTTSWQSNWGIA